MANNSISVTPSQIREHRALRRIAGLIGCKDGSDAPLNSLKGISWRPTDPKNPSCFCTDCRGTWDTDGTIDAELVNAGHQRAVYTYESLLRSPLFRALTRFDPGHSEAPTSGVSREALVSHPSPPSPSSLPPPPLLQRTLTHYPGVLSCEQGCGCGYWEGEDKNRKAGGGGAGRPPATPPLLPRIKIPPRANEGEFHFSLPAPRHRDIMNETHETRLKNDLCELLISYRGDMITMMDSRRPACFYDNRVLRDEFMNSVNKKEYDLWQKIQAAECLIRSFDD